MPAAEVDADLDLVRSLLLDQFPDLADQPLTPLAHGWDNISTRVGGSLVVRMPRRAVAAELIEHEQSWLSALAGRLPLPIPVPMFHGRPGAGFPWSWSICPYLPGINAAATTTLDVTHAGEILAIFAAALHVTAPARPPATRQRRAFTST